MTAAAHVTTAYFLARTAFRSTALLPVCLVFAAVWVRSLVVGDWFQVRITRLQDLELHSADGALWGRWARYETADRTWPTLYHVVKTLRRGRDYMRNNGSWQTRIVGFSFESEDGLTAFRIPYWALLVAGGTAIVLRARRRGRPSRRAAHGLCHQCGYDLRQSPASCPECGSAKREPATPKPPSARRRRVTRATLALALLVSCGLVAHGVHVWSNAPPLPKPKPRFGDLYVPDDATATVPEK